MIQKGLKGTWSQALITFCSPFIIFLALRWCVVEPFVIPSGSMIPTLLIHDHVLVTKFSYGLKIPFSDHWLMRWREPKRGEVIVFRYPKNPEVYFIKRLIGVPGDKIEVKNGFITVNGTAWKTEPLESGEDEDFNYFQEQSEDVSHRIRLFKSNIGEGASEIFQVPEHNYFFMGDNRDQSSDGRYWGFVDESLIIGPARFVWLSCSETLASAQFVCSPQTIRWNRVFTNVK